MKARPMLMSAPMVRAILAGTKTQTRRVVKPQPQRVDGGVPFGDAPAWAHAEPGCAVMRCPYGKRGDRLWIREAWARTTVFPGSEMVVYREGDNRTDYGGPWKPGIHMFRRDSRITLDVTGVRVERLQDISVADAIAEGVNIHPDHHSKPRESIYSPVQAYRDLWESINGPGSWEVNPWVWVVEFKRLEAQQ
ncbi:MAG: hypothetical protein AB1455_09875 [Pseudomonadota bacterium]